MGRAGQAGQERQDGMLSKVSRRDLLRAAAALGGVALGHRRLTSQTRRTRLILLGTGGGPRPRQATAAPSQVIFVNDTPYIVDCGDASPDSSCSPE
jgi:hypothetical protein